ncbi:hypothetical protein [uncultured Rothia sp.]|uniref:hypothetical protein n=1 Tax=uncultured Rothia sp. TaxID=316088 RepID=UPI0028E4965B|nr:hypothetical protein [uncultured Rothia sp.]
MRIPSYTITRSCHGKTAPFSLPFLRYGDARKQSAQRKAIVYGRLPLQVPMICSALKIWRHSK